MGGGRGEGKAVLANYNVGVPYLVSAATISIFDLQPAGHDRLGI